MSYQVEITPFAQRQIKKLSPEVQAKIIEKLEALEEEPRPAGIKKLQGERASQF